MTTPPKDTSQDTEPVLTLIKNIKEGKVNPSALTAEDRRRCVDVLWSEGYGVAETASILKCAERTIYRDRTELRASHALQTHPQFPQQIAGELMRNAEISISRLRRIAREQNASAMERLMAESSAFKVHIEMIGKLQSMGYLPRMPTGVVAQVVGGFGSDAIATYDQLAERLDEIESVDRELGQDDPKRREYRRALSEVVRLGRTGAEIDRLYHSRQEN